MESLEPLLGEWTMDAVRVSRGSSSARSIGEMLIDCPTCGLPAEITDRFTLRGAPEPVEHVKLVCVQRHFYTLPVDSIDTSPDAGGNWGPRRDSARGGALPG